MIPENVIEVLAEIDDGQTNMQDRGAVIQIVDVMDEGAADWLRDNPRLYNAALETVRGRNFGGAE